MKKPDVRRMRAGPLLGALRRQTLHSPSICIQAELRRQRREEVSQRTILGAPQNGRPDSGIDVVSFFNRAWSQGGSLSELAKPPGTSLTTTRGEIWPTNWCSPHGTRLSLRRN